MKIIFHCYSGSYYSATAAAVYLHLLPINRVPAAVEFDRLPYFDAIAPKDYGKLYMMGCDDRGNEVFIMARRSLDKVAVRVLRGIAKIYGFSPNDLIFIDSTGPLSNLLSFGNFLSVRLGLPKLGRPLVVREIRRLYSHFPALSREAEHLVHNGNLQTTP